MIFAGVARPETPAIIPAHTRGTIATDIAASEYVPVFVRAI